MNRNLDARGSSLIQRAIGVEEFSFGEWAPFVSFSDSPVHVMNTSPMHIVHCPLYDQVERRNWRIDQSNTNI